MNYYNLLESALPSAEPLYVGSWGTLLLRPDLGSQQQFVVGVMALISNDSSPHIRWLPSFSVLSRLYGDETTANELSDLTSGSELSISLSYQADGRTIDSGTPHIQFLSCGYFSADDIGHELTQLLKRHAGPIWAEANSRDIQLNDEWAYSLMREAMDDLNARREVFTPNQTVVIQGKTLKVGLKSDESFGNIVSACYTNFQTIERHIYSSIAQVSMAHRLSRLASLPAIFVVLPSPNYATHMLNTRKSTKFLSSIEDMGIIQYCDSEPKALAERIKAWADA